MRPERWLGVTVTDPSPDRKPLLTEGLLALGGRAVEEGPDGLTTWVPAPPDPQEWVREARVRLADLVPGEAPTLTWRIQDQEDWAEVWKRGLGPRRVSGRIRVTPSWEPVEAAEGEVVVIVDPGMAFGTAEHATTRGCLRLMDGSLRTGDRILDVGAGSAILSIAAAKLGAAEVIALESDSLAWEPARENLVRNGVEARVRLVEVEATPEVLRSLGPFAGVLANIESGILQPLLPGLADATAPDGWLVLSGILAVERSSMLDAVKTVGLVPDAEDLEHGWWSVRLRRG